ncbi:hypothetical protein DRO51_05090 [Candidatus Bathyarchaeota archaeon]|nr:MAG: hypothetical protein DRO51_05090 [Candidatus Bathyarchaeota archaeon]
MEGKTVDVEALFDSGSNFTVMGFSKLEKLFGRVKVKPLPKPVKATLINGQQILVEGFVDAELTLKNGYIVSERIYLSRDMVEEAEVEGRKIRIPDLIIGAPTMETWGIELDLKKGDIVVRGTCIF